MRHRFMLGQAVPLRDEAASCLPEGIGLARAQVQVPLHDLIHRHAAGWHACVRPHGHDAVRAAGEGRQTSRPHRGGPRRAIRLGYPGDSCHNVQFVDQMLCTTAASATEPLTGPATTRDIVRGTEP